MGNCCKPASSMEWDGEDWSSLRSSKSSSKVFDEAHGHVLSLGKVQKKKLVGTLRASSDANGRVKIKMSKKELAELLGEKGKQQQQVTRQVEVRRGGSASAEQVLLRLINARNHANGDHYNAGQRFWRPVLESIPEVS